MVSQNYDELSSSSSYLLTKRRNINKKLVNQYNYKAAREA